MEGYNPYASMRQTPMFINWEPIRLDMGPVERGSEFRMRLAMQFADEADKMRQRAMEAKMPELKDLRPNDAAAIQQEWLSARDKWHSELMKEGNPFAHARSEESMAAIRQMANAASPALMIQGKERLDSSAVYKKSLDEAKGEAGMFFGPDGQPIPDPVNSGAFLSASDAYNYAINDPRFAINQPGAEGLDFRGAAISLPSKLRERLNANYKGVGWVERGGPVSDADNLALYEMAANLNAPAADRTLAAVYNAVRSKSNFGQLMAVASDETAKLNQEDSQAVMNAYYQSPEYARDLRNGHLTVDGKLSVEKLHAAVFGTEKWAQRHGTMLGGDKKTSYANAFIINEGAKYLASSNLIDQRLLKESIAGGGGGGDETYPKGKINIFHGQDLFGFHSERDQLTNEVVPRGRMVQRSYPSKTSSFKVEGQEHVSGLTENGKFYVNDYPKPAVPLLNKYFNVPEEYAFPETPVSDPSSLPLLKQLTNASQVVMPQGRPLSHAEAQGTRFRFTGAGMFAPADWGRPNEGKAKTGKQHVQYAEIELYTSDDDDPLKDFTQLSHSGTMLEVPINDPRYAPVMDAEMRTSDSWFSMNPYQRNLTDQATDRFGLTTPAAHTIKAYVRVTDGMRGIEASEFMVDPKIFTSGELPQQGEDARENSYLRNTGQQ